MAPATTEPGRWGDLSTRVASGVALAIIGLVAIVLGGVWFQILVLFAIAVMIWELWMMAAPEQPVPGMLFAVLGGAILSAVSGADDLRFLALFCVIPVVGALRAPRVRVGFFLYALALQLGGWALLTFRTEFGLTFLMWIVAIVVVTDIAGYFAGRMLGGPKFWPRISPKKTWSGTVAGWVGAMAVSACFVIWGTFGWVDVALAVLVSFAGQMGDIAKSAVKRKVGVKDSSTLIPGHGGFIDRFDALLGAVLFVALLTATVGIAGLHL